MAINIADADTGEVRIYSTLQELAEDIAPIIAPIIAQQIDEGGEAVQLESTTLAALEGQSPSRTLSSGKTIEPGADSGVVISRAAIEPLVQAKTRGELIEKLGELLAVYGITIEEA